MSAKTAPLVDAQGTRADAALIPPPADLPDFGAESTLTPVDRSTLERYQGCCFAARCAELGRVIDRSRPADIGIEIHEAYSWTTEEYVKTGIGANPSDLADTFRGRLLQARPDIQHDVCQAAYHCAWSWATFLAGDPRKGGGIHPNSIEAFDGGASVGKPGQFAAELGGCTVTGAFDLLYRGHAPNTLHLRDWKSGRKKFSATSVYASFQFQTYVVLIFESYPEIDRVEVTIEATRENDEIGPVVFLREDLPKFAGRVIGAVVRRNAYHGRDPDSLTAADCTAGRETCPICPAVRLCPIGPPWSVAYDPPAAAVALYALEAQVKSLKSELTDWVDENGEIEGPICFGYEKPATTKPKPATYFQGANDNADDRSEDEQDGSDPE